MKQIFLAFVFLAVVQVTNAQITGIKDSTTTLLKGTYAKDGKIFLKSGYQFKISPDKKVATVMAMMNNGVTGKYTCDCTQGSSCGLVTTGRGLYCEGPACCGLIVTTDPSVLENPANNKNNNKSIKWKVLVLPAKSN